jgi:hypothetical protein
MLGARSDLGGEPRWPDSRFLAGWSQFCGLHCCSWSTRDCPRDWLTSDRATDGAPGSPGVFGPVSGPFANPGLFSSGPFTLTTGILYVETYDTFNDDGIDQIIRGGSLLVHYTVIPEPATGVLALVAGLVMLGVRRRK